VAHVDAGHHGAQLHAATRELKQSDVSGVEDSLSSG
jgi:hypothetical protein